MTLADRVASRFAVMRLTTLALGLVGAFYAAKRLGIENFGVYASGAALVPVVGALGLAGLDQLYLRKSLDLRTLRLLLAKWACISGGVGVAVAACLPGLPTEARIVAILLIANFSAEIARGWWLLEPQRRGRLEVRARREFVYRTLLLGATLVSVTVWPTSLSAAVAPTIVGVFFLLVVRSAKGGEPQFAKGSALGPALRQAAGYTASGAVYTIYMSVPSISVALLAGIQEAGAFRIAYVLYGAMTVVPIALNNEAMRADLYRNSESSSDFTQVRERFRSLNLRAAAITVAGGIFISLLGIRPSLGAEYAGSVAPALILCMAAPFHFANSYLGNLAVGESRLREVTAIQSLGVLVSTIACPIGSVIHGAAGAAAAMVLVEATLAFVYGSARHRRSVQK